MSRFSPILLIASLALPSVAQGYQFKRTDEGAALHWRAHSEVAFVIQQDGVDDIDDGSDLEAVRDAFSSWQTIEGMTVSFRDDGLTPTQDAGYDQANPESNTNTIA